MTCAKTIRDPKQDQLSTPQNAALLIIDYQPVQVSSLASRSKRELVANLPALAHIGKPTSWVQLICEFWRDWNRKETVPGFAEVLFAVEGR
jgi:hypothetical protein